MNDLRAYLRFRDGFKQALDRRQYPIEHLDHLVLSGGAHVLSSQQSCILVELKTYPSGSRDVHGLIAAGDLQDIVTTLIPEAEAWGRANGCDGALIESRPGWARLLKPYGYEPHQLAVRKEL